MRQQPPLPGLVVSTPRRRAPVARPILPCPRPTFLLSRSNVALATLAVAAVARRLVSHPARARALARLARLARLAARGPAPRILLNRLPRKNAEYHSSKHRRRTATRRCGHRHIDLYYARVGVGLGAKPPRGQQTAITRVPERTAPAWHIRSVLVRGQRRPEPNLPPTATQVGDGGAEGGR